MLGKWRKVKRWLGGGGRRRGPAVHIGVGYLVDIPGLTHETRGIRKCFIRSQEDLELRRVRCETTW